MSVFVTIPGIARRGHFRSQSGRGSWVCGAILGNETLVILGRVDAAAGMMDDADANRPTVSESAKLFELLQLFERMRW